MTFTLISTVYACGIAKPGHGSMTPLAVGFSLIACAGAGGKYTGGLRNPPIIVKPDRHGIGCVTDQAEVEGISAQLALQWTLHVLPCNRWLSAKAATCPP